MEWMILPLKRYADFSGRSRRKEFWMFQLLNLIVSAVLLMPLLLAVISDAARGGLAEDPADLDALTNAGTLPVVMLVLYGIYALAVFLPSLAVTVRRLHDRDMSGWWYLGFILVGLIPVIGAIGSIALLVVMALPGNAGANRFGPDPKDPFSADVFA